MSALAASGSRCVFPCLSSSCHSQALPLRSLCLPRLWHQAVRPRTLLKLLLVSPLPQPHTCSEAGPAGASKARCCQDLGLPVPLPLPPPSTFQPDQRQPSSWEPGSGSPPSSGSLIQVPMSEKGKITRGRLGSLSLKKEGERQCFLFSKHLIICTRGSGGKLHLTKVRVLDRLGDKGH